MRRPHRPAHRLRQTIDCMPLETRRAMLHALATDPIIVGAYTDREGGVCPMLAAHRNGGRTSFASFAAAWDRYTRAGRSPRRATEREVRTLRAMLEASIAAASRGELAAAIESHRLSKASPARPKAPRRRPRADTGERDRTGELERRHGWAWLRPFRRLDEFERAVGDAERAAEAGSPRREPATSSRPRG